MGERRSDWVRAKRELERAGVETHKVFKEDFGSALDNYDDAAKATEKARASSRNPRTDPALTAAKRELGNAFNRATTIGRQYSKDVTFLQSWSKSATAKKALDDADGALVRILGGLRTNYDRLK